MVSWALAFIASCGKQAIGQPSSAGPKRLPMPSDSQDRISTLRHEFSERHSFPGRVGVRPWVPVSEQG